MKMIEANGARMPALGFGTWTLKDDHCQMMVSAAIAAGYRHIDTAAMYANEEAVGAGIRDSGIAREKLFVTTKVWWTDIGAGDLERSAERSLRALGLDQVDLLLIHWPSRTVPLAECIGALNHAAELGFARNIGVSNFTLAMLEEAVHLSDRPLACNQVEYHPMLDQSRMIEACRSHGMALVSYCPLFRGGDLFTHPAVTSAAAAHGKSPAQIVLRWHMQQDPVAAIPRTSRPERIAENLDIFDFQLGEAEMAAISALRNRNERICDFEFSPDWD